MEETRNLPNFNTSEFISSLTTYLQVLCNGQVPFTQNVEVIGHIYLNVDCGTKFNYFLNEVVTKTENNSTKFTSNSFHAKPQTEDNSPSDKSCVSATPKIKVSISKSDNATDVPENRQSPFFPKIINVHSVSQSNVGTSTKTTESVESSTSSMQIETETARLPPPTPSELSDIHTSVSEILKHIKKEPVEHTEAESSAPKPIDSTSSVTASSLTTFKQKRKANHTMRVDYSLFKPTLTPNNNASKRPRIIKPRSSASILKRKADISPGTECGSESNTGVYPVAMMKNKNVVEKTGLSDTSFVLMNLKDQEEELNKKLPISTSAKRRGTYNFYSQDEKHQAVELSAKFGIAPICQRFGIPSSTLWTWKKQFELFQASKSGNESETTEEPGIKQEPKTEVDIKQEEDSN